MEIDVEKRRNQGRVFGALFVVFLLLSVAFFIHAFVSRANAAGVLNSAYTFIDTNYPIPATNVKFVDPNGNDSNDGSQASPYKTIQWAHNNVSDGGTIVMNSGVYRSPVVGITKAVTIQAAPHAEVWIKGSRVVTNWAPSGSVWVSTGWAPNFCHTCTTNPNSSVEGMAAYPEQIFINEQPLTQVATQAEVAVGKFYVDAAAQTLYIGSDPTAKTVEVSEHQRALSVAANNFKMLGINVAQYAPQQGFATGAQPFYAGPSAVYVAGTNALIENSLIVQSAANGLSMGNSTNSTIRNSQFLDNGSNGMGANRSDNILVDNSRFERNNAAGFNVSSCGDYCGVSDIKITHTQGITFSNNFMANSASSAFWCDEGCIDAKVVNNFISGQAIGAGIFYEVSSQGIIAGNIIEGAKQGIAIGGSDHVQIYNNTISRSNIPIRIYEDPRVNGCNLYNSATSTCTVPESWSISHGLSWDTTDLVVRNNIMSRAKVVSPGETELIRFQGITQQDGSVVVAPDMVGAIDHNAYRRESSSEWHTVWYGSASPTVFFSLGAFTTATGFGTNSIDEVAAGVNANFVREGAGVTDLQVSDYNLIASSTMRNAGLPLPADVAAAIGWTAGVPVNMGALNNQYMALPLPDTTPPVVSLTSPTSGATVSGAISVTANASDNVGVTKVEFYRGTTKIGESTSSPYAVSWDTTTVANGVYALTAVAFDAANNQTTSAAVSVTVNNVVPDVTAPSVVITVPISGATLGGQVAVSVLATDDVGVSRVVYLLDGVQIGQSFASPFGFIFDTTVFPNGSHTLVAQAYDAAGNMASSQGVVVTIANEGGDNDGGDDGTQGGGSSGAGAIPSVPNTGLKR